MRQCAPNFQVLFSVPGDPKHLALSAKAELQYVQFSIFLLDGTPVRSDGVGGEVRRGVDEKKGGRAGTCIFIPKAGAPPAPGRQAPTEATHEAAWTTEAENRQEAAALEISSPPPSRLDLSLEVW